MDIQTIKPLTVTQIKRRATELNLSQKRLADTAKVSLITLHRYFKNRYVPEPANGYIRDLFKNETARQRETQQGSFVGQPITLSEVASVKEASLSLASLSRPLSPWDVSNMCPLTMDQAEEIRRALGLTGKQISEVLGYSTTWWSQRVQSNRELSIAEQKQIRQLFFSFMLMMKGVPLLPANALQPEKKETNEKPIKEALRGLQQFGDLLDQLPTKIEQKIARTYVEAITEELRTLLK